MVKFNDDNSDRGVEGRYWIDGDRHCIYLEPTNSKRDWQTNAMAWPRRRGYHRHWLKDAEWVFHWIEFRVPAGALISIRGLSRGGAVALIVADILVDAGYRVEAFTMGAPKPGRIRNEIPGRDDIWKGDVVPRLPVLYRRPRGRVVSVEGPLLWPWKAHAAYPYKHLKDERYEP